MTELLTRMEDQIAPAHTALLVIDMQNDFCHPEGAFARRGLDISMVQAIVPTVQNLIFVCPAQECLNRRA